MEHPASLFEEARPAALRNLAHNPHAPGQFWGLFMKNVLLLRRRYLLTATMLLCGPAFVLILFGFAQIPDNNYMPPSPPFDPAFPHCFNPTTSNFMIDFSGPIILGCGLSFFAVVAVLFVSAERHAGLYGAIVGAGGSPALYWLSWFAALSLPALVGAIASPLVGLATRMQLFAHANFLVWVLTYLCASLCCLAIGLFVSGVVSRPLNTHMANMVLLGAMITAVFAPLFQTIPANASYDVYDILRVWNNTCVRSAGMWSYGWQGADLGGNSGVVATFFFLPQYQFGRIVEDIVSLTRVANNVTLSTSFTLHDLADRPFPYFDSDTGMLYTLPSSLVSLVALLTTTLLFLWLAWWVSLVFPGRTHLAPRRCCFCFDPIVALVRRLRSGQSRRRHTYTSIEQQSLLTVSGDDSSGHTETANGAYAVQLSELTKCYGKKSVVSNLSIGLNAGEVFAILGHNAAGKTTTLSMVTGSVLPTSGQVRVFGRDVVDEVDAVRRMVSVCRQEDVLWPQLTAREHVELYVRLRCFDAMVIPREEMQSRVRGTLAEMNLHDVADARVATFSGGMKRRLSVALAGVGDARVLVFDEPTTGMDVINRQFVWKFFQRIKSSRVVLLTTHAMEEADLLGDRIGIMNQGELRALGTPLFLKRAVGKGAYKVNVLAREPSSCAAVSQAIVEHVPTAKVVTGAGTSVKVTVDSGGISRMPQLFDWLTASADVTEWGISNTTLEDVFLRVGGTTSTRGDSTTASSSSCCICCCRRQQAQQMALVDDDRIDHDHVDDEDAHDEVTGSEALPRPERLASFGEQMRGVMVKNGRVLRHGGWVFLAVTGALMVIFVALFRKFQPSDGSTAGVAVAGMAYVLPALSLMLPTLVASVVGDHEAGIVELMRVQGLRRDAHFFGMFIYAFVMQLLTSSAFVLVATTIQCTVLVRLGNAGWPLLLLALLTFSYATGCLVVLLSVPFRRAIVASGMVLLVAVALAASATALNAIYPVGAPQPDCVLCQYPVALSLVPHIGFGRALILIFSIYTEQQTDLNVSEIPLALFLAVVSSTVLGAVGLAGHVRWRWGAHTPVAKMTTTTSSSSSSSSVVGTAYGTSDETGHRDLVTNQAAEDESVVEERQAVRRNVSDAVALFYDVSKTYGGSPPKRAVQQLDLTVRRNECLGLLGPNGAGKSTAFGVLAGLNDATAGRVLTVGTVGLCPQFSCVWGDLSTREHLEFFATLCGLYTERVATARRVAAAVGIGGALFELAASRLSGGTKRRLALAIALVGNSSLLLLDEPSTGLDPGARRQIWRVLTSLRDSTRGILMSTHSMEEADAVSTRLAIMAGGRLRAVGSPLGLKQRFGIGFTLQLSLSVSATVERVMDFLRREVHAQAVLVSTNGKLVTVQLPAEGLDLGRAFVTLSQVDSANARESEDSMGVQQWMLSQATLEDVFVRVVGDDVGDLGAIGFARWQE